MKINKPTKRKKIKTDTFIILLYDMIMSCKQNVQNKIGSLLLTHSTTWNCTSSYNKVFSTDRIKKLKITSDLFKCYVFQMLHTDKFYLE